ncbi:glycosyltransferase family 2 protein [Citrobacter portucalensis]|nr:MULTISPECIES: glycosyltransferase family 2 protein [Citrobacter freundii complex]QNM20219.1 glycosyltransferase family 2 protein [Citrobacter freundii]MEB7911330.1 glycosyltransferase family 2 protein [Citrobacter portucalensis]PKQ51158.1 glycosyltransferase family 2 protein [Citrobacter portucalensis]QNM25679.1 glycosyltransferase family 2 protein [Citrobacter freundii]QNM30372.1 glycosyltransferase family 2 protein [Citrobacter freundii]
MEIIKNKVSVLMPTYNSAKYIEFAIEDIIKQDYSNWELIIIDDGSKDNTKEILEKYRSEKIRVFFMPMNMGISAALNKGLQEAQGEYILRFDSDDRCDCDRISKQLSFLKDHNLDMVGTSVKTISENGQFISKADYSGNTDLLIKLLRYETPMLHIWLAKRTVYMEVGDYRLDGVEDYDFILRAIDLGYQISNIKNYYGVSIRKHDTNTASLHGWDQRRKFNIAWKLHKQRIKFGKEQSSIENFESSNIGNKLHNISNNILKKALIENKIILKCFYSIISALISPYQFQYLTFRLISRLIKFKHENSIFNS